MKVPVPTVILTTALLPAMAQAATPELLLNLFSYHAQVLPLNSAAGMGDGIIVGTANGVAVAYVNAQVVPLTGKAGYTNVQPTSISANGYIVGYARSANNDRGLFWSSYLN